MSRLEELIQQLCPDGVEYKKFENVCQYIRGITYNKAQEAKGADLNPWKVMRANNITYGSNVLNFDDVKLVKREVTVKENQILQRGDILICAGSGSKEHIGKVAYIFDNMDYTFGGFMAVIRCDDELNSRFLFHILTGSSFSVYLGQALNSTTINNLNAGIMKNFLIPIPPIEVQREIVWILDQFTELTAKLTAELTARKKQYEYYRDELFRTAEDSKVYYLNEISENCDNQRKPVTSGNRTAGEYPYYGASGIVDYVDDYIFDGDYLLISEDGANLLARSTPIAFSISGKNWVNNHAHVLRFDTYETRRYVEIYLNSIDLSPYITGGAQPKLNQKNLNKIPIPLPAPDEQRRIVSILDRFDVLCNDLTQGLPAEIEARRKQYEYYRDKLLTFKEKKAHENI